MRWWLLPLLVTLGCQSMAKDEARPMSSAAITREPKPPPPGPPTAPPDGGAKTGEQGTRDGKAAAQKDLQRNLVGYYSGSASSSMIPNPPPYVGVDDILARDFGVRVASLTVRVGCRRAQHYEYKSNFIDAYNATMAPEIKRRHGNDVFDVAEARAAEQTRRLRANAAPSPKKL